MSLYESLEGPKISSRLWLTRRRGSVGFRWSVRVERVYSCRHIQIIVHTPTRSSGSDSRHTVFSLPRRSLESGNSTRSIRMVPIPVSAFTISVIPTFSTTRTPSTRSTLLRSPTLSARRDGPRQTTPSLSPRRRLLRPDVKRIDLRSLAIIIMFVSAKGHRGNRCSRIFVSVSISIAFVPGDTHLISPLAGRSRGDDAFWMRPTVIIKSIIGATECVLRSGV